MADQVARIRFALEQAQADWEGRTSLHAAATEALEALDSLVADYHDRLSRESGRALVDDARRWERAYEQARDELAATKEALGEIHDAQCGCDKPGDPETCIAKPLHPMRALSKLQDNG